MSLVEIVDVKPSNHAAILAHHIERPTPGSQSDLYTMEVGGWVVGREIAAAAVEITCEGRHVCTVPVNRARDDVASRFAAAPGVEKSGYQTTIGTIGMAPDFVLHLQLILQDKSKVSLGMVSGRRQPITSRYQPNLQPIMITALGRTGTTWLMRLLAEHDNIVAYNHYPYEMRVGRYFAHMLKVLSEPADQRHAPELDSFHTNMEQVGRIPFYSGWFLGDPQLRRWFGQSFPEQLAAFCQESIETFYQEVADSQNRTGSELRYFVEKHLPDHLPGLTWEMYPRAREIFLVRDFRDMICSILAFNEKRGFVAFGREQVKDDEEYVMKHSRAGARRLYESWKNRRAHAHLVRYEDLVLHPEETLEALFDYLGLDPTPSVIDQVIQRASKTTREMKQHQTSTDSQSSIGRWQHDLDSSLQKVCAEAFGDILQEFNYA